MKIGTEEAYIELKRKLEEGAISQSAFIIIKDKYYKDLEEKK